MITHDRDLNDAVLRAFAYNCLTCTKEELEITEIYTNVMLYGTPHVPVLTPEMRDFMDKFTPQEIDR